MTHEQIFDVLLRIVIGVLTTCYGYWLGRKHARKDAAMRLKITEAAWSSLVDQALEVRPTKSQSNAGYRS